LVVFFHGAGGRKGDFPVRNAEGAAENAIHVSPSGLEPPRYGLNTLGWDEPCGGYDMVFVTTMLAAIESDYCVDENRRFATGFSWGGDISNSLGWCLGHTFRAVASASGGHMTSADAAGTTVEAGSARKSAYRITYANNDGYVVEKNGSVVNGFENVLDLYRRAHGCADTFDARPSPNIPGKPDGVCKTYTGCDAPVIACFYEEMGHQFPPTWSLDTWNFFASFR
jgi:poly(3-hydroxybutyrate) depolymerase